MRLPHLLAALTLSLASPSVADDVFSASTLSRAQDEAGRDGRLVIVYLYSDRNDDCAFMDREAWTHPDVKRWVGANAIAARVDVFSMHGAALKSRYQLDGAPTVLAFHGETLLRQHRGPIDGAALLTWMQVAHSGDAGIADALHSSSDAGGKGGASVIDLDSALLDAMAVKDNDAAAGALLEAWTLTAGGPQQDQRRRRIVEALLPLTQRSFQAAQRVQTARNQAWGRWERQRRLPDLVDWVALNTLLEEDAATLRWAKAVPDADCASTIAPLLAHPDDPLLPLLLRQRALDVVGRCVAAPLDLLDVRHRTYRQTRVTITGSEKQADLDGHRAGLASISAGLLVVGRNREGKLAARHALELDPKAGPTIVRTALDFKEPRRWHRSMLDMADRGQLDLAIDLARALKSN
jgi:hypothetical protein